MERERENERKSSCRGEEGDHGYTWPSHWPLRCPPVSNAIINYLAVIWCYRTCASPSLFLPLIRMPPFSFTWLIPLLSPRSGSPSFPFFIVFRFVRCSSWHSASRSRLTRVNPIRVKGREGFVEFSLDLLALTRTDYRATIFIPDTRITSRR